ncbi:hypothetical protein J6590_020345 [Homalodisca vitripennis]|nr:hypothetical protein J6590_020345 [Homalodisca vitripennis]
MAECDVTTEWVIFCDMWPIKLEPRGVRSLAFNTAVNTYDGNLLQMTLNTGLNIVKYRIIVNSIQAASKGSSNKSISPVLVKYRIIVNGIQAASKGSSNKSISPVLVKYRIIVNSIQAASKGSSNKSISPVLVSEVPHHR